MRTRGEETRERLLQAALTEFCAHGFAGASTAAIVAAADCNVRMIYHYFGNKEGLYRAALQRVYDELRDAEDKLSFWQLPPREGITELTRLTFDYMAKNPRFPRMILSENLAGGATVRQLDRVYKNSRPLISKMDALIERGFQEGVFRCRPRAIDLYLTMLALSFIHLSNVHSLSVTFGEDLTDPAFLMRRRDHAVEVVLGYLGAL